MKFKLNFIHKHINTIESLINRLKITYTTTCDLIEWRSIRVIYMNVQFYGATQNENSMVQHADNNNQKNNRYLRVVQFPSNVQLCIMQSLKYNTRLKYRLEEYAYGKGVLLIFQSNQLTCAFMDVVYVRRERWFLLQSLMVVVKL